LAEFNDVQLGTSGINGMNSARISDWIPNLLQTRYL